MRAIFQEPALTKLKTEYTLIDMHVHSKYSHDSNTPIQSILSRAKQLNVGVSITDHNRVKGAIEAAKQRKVMIIPGIELLAKENVELLVYFYSLKDLEQFYCTNIEPSIKKATKNKSAFTRRFSSPMISNLTMTELIDKANDYSCVKSIPHPFCLPPRHTYSFFHKHKIILKKVEAIEVSNSSMMPFMNKKACAWFVKTQKSATAGSDAHTIKNFGTSLVACKARNAGEFLDEIKKKENVIFGKEIKFYASIEDLIDLSNIKNEKAKNGQ